MKQNDLPPELLSMPMQARAAPITAVNAEGRTVDLVWTTGAGVQRYDWYNDRYYTEELSLDPAHVRMGRLQSGKAPLLNTHARWDLSSVFGVVRTAALEGAQGVATVEFSKREDVEPYYQDVVDGIISNVSVGYTVFEYDRIPPIGESKTWIYRAIDWEPSEISLCPIGADADCGTRSDDPGQPNTKPGPDVRMAPCKFNTRSTSAVPSPAAAGTQTRKDHSMQVDQNNPAATTAATQVLLDAARTAGIAHESARQTGIREAVTLGGLDEAFAVQLIGRSDMSAADAGMAVLREKAKRDAAAPTRSAADIRTVSDETEQRRAAMGDAIVLRTNPNVDFRKDVARMEAARQFRGLNLMDMARESVEAAGGSTRSLSRREIAVVAMNLDSDMRARAGMQSTSDFPLILAGTVNRTLRTAYAMQPRTFTEWAREATAPDFREIARTQLSESTAFKQVKEGGEYKMLTFGESAEKYSLSKFGGIVAITWEAIVNDDLGAFDRIPLALAAEAAAIEGDIVYGILTGAAPMSDGAPLFDATHNNLVAVAGPINDVTLGAARAAMRKQIGLKGRVLNLTPTFLICGPDNEGAANKYTSASFVAAKASDINPNFNTTLVVVVDPRIQGLQWYLAATPALVDTIEYAYLEGEQGLFTETRQGFEVDGVQIKARHVFGAKAIDWRGLSKNAGA